MRTIIAGGRNRRLTQKDTAFLSHLYGAITEVVTGGATGVDTDADDWAKSRDIPRKTFTANWDDFGRAAGPLRNKAMAAYAAGGLCVLFPGGPGTANMAREAAAAGMTLVDRRHLIS